MGAFLRKYSTGSGSDLWLPIVKRSVVEFAIGTDWTPVAGDVRVSKDGAASANIGTLPTALAMGNTAVWRFQFADTELQCKRLVVTVSDAATKVVEDQCFIVETFGHASAMYQVDYTDVMRFGLTGIPNASAGASGGLTINGSNLGTTTFNNLTVTNAFTANLTGNVTGNVTGSVGSVATAGANALADAILRRDTSFFENSLTEHTLGTVILAMLEWNIEQATWRIYKSDRTPHLTKALSTGAGTNPITGVD